VRIVFCHIKEQYIIMVFYCRTFLQMSSSAGSVRGTQSQGSGGSRNPNRMSTAPILGTSAITSPSGGKILLKKFSKCYYSYIMARSKVSLLPCLPVQGWYGTGENLHFSLSSNYIYTVMSPG